VLTFTEKSVYFLLIRKQYCNQLQPFKYLSRILADFSLFFLNMADNENKDVEDMMTILAQMEEKAKNMERLVVLRRQEREQMEKENEMIQQKLDSMKQAMDEEDEENGRLDNNESK